MRLFFSTNLRFETDVCCQFSKLKKKSGASYSVDIIILACIVIDNGCVSNVFFIEIMFILNVIKSHFKWAM